ncbi:hypothetical protein [Massilia sp. BKSP1R2A-1]|uniref:hypothetical protein n=1 Tax=Massilia sp. BKSP1R2A-1 TaxID=3422595 RepID=UPI003D33918B
MNSPARRRWAVILTALAATVAAIFYPVDEAFPEQARANAPAPKTVAPSALVNVNETPANTPWIASDENPFAPRAWEPPSPPPSAQTREVQTVEIAQAPAEQPPPPLPYTFLGQMQNDGEQILYLGRSDQVLLARKGDVLESSYKVVEVSSTQVEFESVQSGIRQALPIPAQ